MEIINYTPSLREAAMAARNISSANMKVDQLPMSSLVHSLNLDHQDDDRHTWLRLELHDTLQAMPEQKREEVRTTLRQLQRASGGTELGQILDEKMPDVEKEAKSGTNIDRLMDLLFTLIAALGKGQAARSVSSAKFAEMSVKLAQASGQKGIDAANINLCGTIAGFAFSAITAGIGFGVSARASSNNIDNLRTNSKFAENMKKTNIHVDGEMKRPALPATGKSPQERLNVIETQKGKVNVEPCQKNLQPEENAVLRQPLQRTEEQIQKREFAFRERQHKHEKQKVAGHAISGMVNQVGGLMPAIAGAEAAAQNAASKTTDAEGQVASTIQRSDEQQAQHATELLMKLFAQIVSVTDLNRGVLDAISQGIKV